MVLSLDIAYSSYRQEINYRSNYENCCYNIWVTKRLVVSVLARLVERARTVFFVSCMDTTFDEVMSDA